MDGGDREKTKLVTSFKAFLETFSTSQTEKSKVMLALADIVSKQAFNRDLNANTPDKMDKIIHSLLSSPCNFTPLLHFIIPVEYMDLKAFAEIWIDQNDYEEEPENSTGENTENIHMMVVFDVDKIGQFEVDLFSIDKKVDIVLSCPPYYTEAFQSISDKIIEDLSNSPYEINKMTVTDLEKNHSLMEIFRQLPHKRTGLDVTI